jgi:chitin synthase
LTEYETGAYAPFLQPDTELLLKAYAGSVLPEDLVSKLETGTIECLDQLYSIGTSDFRVGDRCVAATNISSVMLFLTLVLISFKFIASVRLAWFDKTTTDDVDKYVIMFVPCYTEDSLSLQRTFESLATCRYPSEKKLIFVVCDGMVMGSGNKSPTPDIVVELLGLNAREGSPILPYLALGNDVTAYNFAQVFSGYYRVGSSCVPVVVVVKVGQPGERNKPGNRGKRDSQLILMRFLNKVFFQSRMTPLELELYHVLNGKLGMKPEDFEYLFMVDADTVVEYEAVSELAVKLAYDPWTMAVTGVTKVSNRYDSFWSMVQVYEYFQSHHLSKAFESLFGMVTCVPGCFAMWRIKDERPLLISTDVIHSYGIKDVKTLHDKNLMLLGEDRYLTTLLLKNFPGMKTRFTPEAVCMTEVPPTWHIFKSQRRRWINSTVHNSLELLLVDNMCFSMRVLVFLDLFSTFVLPAATFYIAYLLFLFLQSPLPPYASLIMISVMYALQMLVILARGEFEYLGWLFVHILAFPVYMFYFPVYSFWHFDDFSWGATRVTTADAKKRRLSAFEELNQSSAKYNIKNMPMIKLVPGDMQWREEYGDVAPDQSNTDAPPPAEVSHKIAMSGNRLDVLADPMSPTTPKLDKDE